MHFVRMPKQIFLTFCDIAVLIRNIYLVFIPISGTELLKPLTFHKCENDKNVFFMLMSAEGARQGGLVARESQLQGERGWRLNQLPLANDLISHAYITKLP